MKILNDALTGKLFMQSKSFNLLLVLVDMREGFCLYQARAHCVSLEIQNLMWIPLFWEITQIFGKHVK